MLVDWSAEMKQERSRLAKKSCDIRKSEEIQTRITDKWLDVFLDVRKDNSERWKKRVVQSKVFIKRWLEARVTVSKIFLIV